MSFVPVISVADSVINPGLKVFVWHMPGGLKEKYGVVGRMAFDVCRDEYTQSLKKRFKIDADPALINEPAISVLASATPETSSAETGPVIPQLKCGCGRDWPHGGRCKWRREKAAREIAADSTLTENIPAAAEIPAEPVPVRPEAAPLPCPVSPASAQIATRTVSLRGGGSITVSVSVDLFGMNREDREFIYGLVDALEGYARG